MPTEQPATDATQDVGLLRLTSAEMFPGVGTPIHVNNPLHNGDVPLHDHDFMELALVVDGHGLHRTIHGQQPIRRGDAFFIHPWQWHGYDRARGLSMYNCCFATALLTRELAWTRSDPVLAPVLPPRLPGDGDRRRGHPGQGIHTLRFDDHELTAVVAELEALRHLQDRTDVVGRRAECLAHLLLLLGAFAQRYGQGRSCDAVPEARAHQALTAALEALEDRLEHDWSLDELAALVQLNRSYLVRLFSRGTGLSPMAYLARRRAEKAAVLLLTTDRPIATIGKTVGWQDPNYFARRFRAAFGMTASTYRAQLPTPALTRADDWIQW